MQNSLSLLDEAHDEAVQPTALEVLVDARGAHIVIGCGVAHREIVSHGATDIAAMVFDGGAHEFIRVELRDGDLCGQLEHELAQRSRDHRIDEAAVDEAHREPGRRDRQRTVQLLHRGHQIGGAREGMRKTSDDFGVLIGVMTFFLE